MVVIKKTLSQEEWDEMEKKSKKNGCLIFANPKNPEQFVYVRHEDFREEYAYDDYVELRHKQSKNSTI